MTASSETPPLVALVMAGGTGTRLYPASRSDRPKQFLSLGGAGDSSRGGSGEESLLERTVERVSFADEIYVSTGDEYAEQTRETVRGTALEADILVEPEAKDTGPALVYAAHRIREQVGECVLCCVPSDHVISGDFESTGRTAARAAVETGGLVTVGIEPTRPATGYGYVEPASGAHGAQNAHDGYARVAQFREKPDRETAARFVEGGFYWNAGIFAWTPDALLDEARHSPLDSLVEALDAGEAERGFAAVESVSVDYAVMERTDDAYVVPAEFDWDDLGSWDALERVVETDDSANAILGDALTVDSSGNVVAGDTHVSLVGVEDMVVAAYDDRVLVVPKDDAQRVREVVAELRERGEF